MTQEEYARDYAGGHARTGKGVPVPADVRRASVSEPCFMCGTARDVCRHRKLAA